jgi:hypothetical protein
MRNEISFQLLLPDLFLKVLSSNGSSNSYDVHTSNQFYIAALSMKKGIVSIYPEV